MVTQSGLAASASDGSGICLYMQSRVVRAEPTAKKKKYLAVAERENMSVQQFKAYVDGQNGVVKAAPRLRTLWR